MVIILTSMIALKKILRYRYYLLIPFVGYNLKRNSKKNGYDMDFKESFDIALQLAKCNLELKKNKK